MMQVLLFVVTLMTDASGVNRPIYVLAFGGKVGPTLRVVAVVAHTLGVVHPLGM